MSTVTAAPARFDTRTHRVTVPRVLRAEWIKFWTLRSTTWTLTVTASLMAAVSFLAVFFTARDAYSSDTPPEDAQQLLAMLREPTIVLTGIELAQLAVAVLGVLVITGEYSTGMIRSTLTAVPRRLPALWAKAVVVSVATAIAALVGTAASLAVAYPTLHSHGVAIDLADPETIRILLGGTLYLVGIALLALGVGAIIRVSAGALATILGMLLVVENLFRMLPVDLFRSISPFLPATAGHQVMATQVSVDQARATSTAPVLDPFVGLAVLGVWVCLLLLVAAVTLRRRDA